MVRHSRRRRTYTTRRQRSGNAGYSFSKVITRGTTTLNGGDLDNRINRVNLLTSPESNTFYGKDLTTRGNSVVGLRGSWWFWTDATLDSAAIQSLGFISVGLISENQDQVTQIDTNAEIAATGPLDLEGRYRPWHYRRTVPVINRFSPAESATVVFDQAHQVMLSRQGIGARRPEKFMSIRDSYFMYAQAETDVTFDVGIAWQLQFYIKAA